MPYLHLKISHPPTAQATPALRQRLAHTLTDLTAEVLGKKRELTAITVETVPTNQWWIGGTPLADDPAHSFHLDIKVTEGSNSADEKARYIAAVFAAMEQHLGPLQPASYVVVHDVAGDAWGYQGQTQAARRGQAQAL